MVRLAATRIGEPLQVAVVAVRPGNPRYPYEPPIPLTVPVNPVVTALTDETFANHEGGLSVRNLRGVVDRVDDTRWHQAAFTERAEALVARFGS